MRTRLSIIMMLLLAGLAACRAEPPASPTATATVPPTPTVPAETASPTPNQAATEDATPTPAGIYGPTGFPPDVNPLTGLPVDDPVTFDRRPLLIKVSNESQDVRPWSGLAFADHVWMYQMEGFAQTRFTAVIYSQMPERVGSVRSTRLIDIEHLVDMYGGILVTSGGSTNRHAGGPPRIHELLRAAPWTNRVVNADFGFGAPYLVRIPDIPRPGVASWHTLFAVPAEIWRWAEEQGLNERQPLEGLAFDPSPPPGGQPTTQASVDYPGYGPKQTWTYNAASGRWESATNDVPDGDTLLPPGEPLAFDNVVVLYAPHYEADFIEDEPSQLYSVGVELTGEGKAVLLRDGQRYEVTWRRADRASMIQFFNAGGQMIPFKPGTTWFNVASSNIFPPEVTFTP